MTSPQEIKSPYVGLQPFGEKYQPFFFGREREIRVISSNLLVPVLTVLYGPSGVGKSSILQAGVMPYLRAQPDTSAIYFSQWQDDRFLDKLKTQIQAVMPRSKDDARPDGNAPLDELAQRSKQALYLLLDQFEEYLMYHESTDLAGQFDSALARIVNTESSNAKVLIGIREDGLSRFDRRFSIRIPDLLGNTLPVAPLSAKAAGEAIREPLRVWNETRVPNGSPYRIQDNLVNTIVREVQTGMAGLSEMAGRGATAAPDGERSVETAYLQLVLARLWDAEVKAGSRELQEQTLTDLGGSVKILQTHVDEVMAGLDTDEDRAIAASIFEYLVTPSGTKIAQAPGDLVQYASASENRVRSVLRDLTDRQDTRILRRLSTPERYELYHDVLAQGVLDWCRRYWAEQRRKEEQDRQKEETDRRERELEQAKALAKEKSDRLELQRKLDEALRQKNLDVVSLDFSGAPGASTSVEDIRHMVEDTAQRTLSYQFDQRERARRFSRILRFFTVAFSAAALLEPGTMVIWYTSWGATFNHFTSVLVFYLFLCGAVGAAAIEWYFGFARAESAYADAAETISHALSEFQLDWITTTQLGAPKDDLIGRARDFQMLIEDVVQRERRAAAGEKAPPAKTRTSRGAD